MLKVCTYTYQAKSSSSTYYERDGSQLEVAEALDSKQCRWFDWLGAQTSFRNHHIAFFSVKQQPSNATFNG